MSYINSDQLPAFLSSYMDLKDHLDDKLKDMSTTDKGNSFAEFASYIIPVEPEFGAQFSEISVGKKSHDGGIDLFGESADRSIILFGQSKYTLNETKEFDSVISEFKNYYETNYKKSSVVQKELFEDQSEENVTDVPGQPEVHFLIFTLSRITERIIPSYQSSNRASVSFFKQLMAQGRIHIWDGMKILPILQSI